MKDKKISVLANFAGLSYAHPQYFYELDRDTMTNIINVNDTNTLKLTHAILPQMKERRNGLILNAGSFSGEGVGTFPLLSVYSASKTFLKHWSIMLSHELRKDNVQVTCYNIYYVCSKMSKIKKPTFTAPSPTDFVKAAMRVAGSFDFITPYFSHMLVYTLFNLIPNSLYSKIAFQALSGVRSKAMAKATKSK